MQITDETPRTEITIQGTTFIAPEPFTEGHTLNANEAAALNQLLHENLRNNFAGKVKAAIEEAGGSVENIDGAALQAEFDEYAKGYEFGIRRSGPRVPLDPVAREAQKIAKGLIAKKLKANKVKLDDLPEGKLEALVAAVLAANPAIIETARARVEANAGLVGLEIPTEG